MNKEERVTKTLVARGFSKYEATRIAHEIVRNLKAYSLIQDQREARITALMKRSK